MKLPQLTVITFLAFATSAHAYKAGDTLQYIGKGRKGLCAVQLTVGTLDNLGAKQEFITKINLSTEFDSDHVFANHPDILSSSHLLDRETNLLGMRHFHDDFHESNPDGLGSRNRDESLDLYGKSLDTLGSVSASYDEGRTFTTIRKGKFACDQLRPVTAADYDSAVSSIQRSSARQIEAFQAADAAKRARDADEDARREQADQARQQRKLDAEKAAEEERIREEPAKRAEIDAERANQGLSPIQRDGNGEL